MTDKELLELAAKAAGLNLKWQDNKPHIGDWLSRKWWNPLTDDGDAMRLAVKLNLMIDVVDDDTGVQALDVSWCSEPHNGDPYAATRRAIVRAAAEIGKTK